MFVVEIERRNALNYKVRDSDKNLSKDGITGEAKARPKTSKRTELI